MQPIENPKKTIVIGKCFMVKIMKLRLDARQPGEFEAAMMHLSTEDGSEIPEGSGEKMAPHDEGPDIDRDDVGQEHFDGMAVGCGEGDGAAELVMFAVNLIVKQAPMEE